MMVTLACWAASSFQVHSTSTAMHTCGGEHVDQDELTSQNMQWETARARAVAVAVQFYVCSGHFDSSAWHWRQSDQASARTRTSPAPMRDRALMLASCAGPDALG